MFVRKRERVSKSSSESQLVRGKVTSRDATHLKMKESKLTIEPGLFPWPGGLEEVETSGVDNGVHVVLKNKGFSWQFSVFCLPYFHCHLPLIVR